MNPLVAKDEDLDSDDETKTKKVNPTVLKSLNPTGTIKTGRE